MAPQIQSTRFIDSFTNSQRDCLLNQRVIWMVSIISALIFSVVCWQLRITYPRHDDYVLIQSFARIKSDGLVTTLLEPHNIHPIPLTKSVIWVLWAIWGINAISTGVFSIAFINVCGIVLINSIKNKVSDISQLFLFVILIFGPALPSLVTWPTLVSFALLHGILMIVLGITIRYGDRSASWQHALLTFLMVLLSMCGLPGLVLGLCGGLALAVSFGKFFWNKASVATRFFFTFGGALHLLYSVLAITIVYQAIGERGLTNPGESVLEKLRLAITVALQALANSLGDLGKLSFPLSSIAVLMVYLGCLHLLFRRCRIERYSQSRCYIFGGLLMAFPLIAGMIGAGRSFQGGFALWYFWLFSLSWLVVSVSALTFSVKRDAYVFALIIACTVFPWMWGESIRAQRDFLQAEKELLDDVQKELPISAIASRNRLGYSRDIIGILRTSGKSPFRDIKDDPPFRVLSLSQREGIPVNSEYTHDGLRFYGQNSGLRFELPKAERVALIKLKFDLLTNQRSNDFRILMAKDDKPCGPENLIIVQKNAYFWRPTHCFGFEMAFWVDERIKTLTILPSHKPGVFRLIRAELYCR